MLGVLRLLEVLGLRDLRLLECLGYLGCLAT